MCLRSWDWTYLVPGRTSSCGTRSRRYFFEVVRDKGLLTKAADDDRLTFGVAYFNLLRAWIDGKFEAPVRESTTKEQAHELLAGSLRTLGRTRKWEEVLQAFLARA